MGKLHVSWKCSQDFEGLGVRKRWSIPKPRAPQILCLWNVSVLRAGVKWSAATTEQVSSWLLVYDGQEGMKLLDDVLTISNFSQNSSATACVY